MSAGEGTSTALSVAYRPRLRAASLPSLFSLAALPWPANRAVLGAEIYAGFDSAPTCRIDGGFSSCSNNLLNLY
jgi:hypothetical protein